jgi:hypothetical protein
MLFFFILTYYKMSKNQKMTNPVDTTILAMKYLLILISLYMLYKINVYSKKYNANDILDWRYKFLLVSPLLILLFDIYKHNTNGKFNPQMEKLLFHERRDYTYNYKPYLIIVSEALLYILIGYVSYTYIYDNLVKRENIEDYVSLNFMKLTNGLVLVHSAILTIGISLVYYFNRL